MTMTVLQHPCYVIMQLLSLNFRTSHPSKRQNLNMWFYARDALEHFMYVPAAASAAAAAVCAYAPAATLPAIVQKWKQRCCSNWLRHDADPAARRPNKSSI